MMSRQPVTAPAQEPEKASVGHEAQKTATRTPQLQINCAYSNVVVAEAAVKVRSAVSLAQS